jgi:hypothetical protein
MQTITHADGTEYKVERRGTGRISDRYFVYSVHGYFPVYAITPAEAVDKARAAYTAHLINTGAIAA